VHVEHGVRRHSLDVSPRARSFATPRYNGDETVQQNDITQDENEHRWRLRIMVEYLAFLVSTWSIEYAVLGEFDDKGHRSLSGTRLAFHAFDGMATEWSLVGPRDQMRALQKHVPYDTRDDMVDMSGGMACLASNKVGWSIAELPSLPDRLWSWWRPTIIEPTLVSDVGTLAANADLAPHKRRNSLPANTMVITVPRRTMRMPWQELRPWVRDTVRPMITNTVHTLDDNGGRSMGERDKRTGIDPDASGQLCLCVSPVNRQLGAHDRIRGTRVDAPLRHIMGLGACDWPSTSRTIRLDRVWQRWTPFVARRALLAMTEARLCADPLLS